MVSPFPLCLTCFSAVSLQAKPIYGGWLLLAPEGTDFDNPVHRSRVSKAKHSLPVPRVGVAGGAVRACPCPTSAAGTSVHPSSCANQEAGRGFLQQGSNACSGMQGLPCWAAGWGTAVLVRLSLCSFIACCCRFLMLDDALVGLIRAVLMGRLSGEQSVGCEALSCAGTISKAPSFPLQLLYLLQLIMGMPRALERGCIPSPNVDTSMSGPAARKGLRGDSYLL